VTTRSIESHLKQIIESRKTFSPAQAADLQVI